MPLGCSFPQPHARPAAILGDELDASGFKGGADRIDGPCLSGVSGPGIVSNRFIDGREIDEASAKFFCSHRSRARAARICSLVTILIPRVLTMPEASTYA